MSKNQCLHFSSVAIDLILFKLADIRRKCISWMYSNFGQIGQQTTVTCPCHEYPKTKLSGELFKVFFISYWVSVERPLPFGLLVISPEPKAHQRPSVVVHNFKHLLLQNRLANQAKFYMKPPWVGGTKVRSQHLGHMTKMAATPIYGKKTKNPSQDFSGTS